MGSGYSELAFYLYFILFLVHTELVELFSFLRLLLPEVYLLPHYIHFSVVYKNVRTHLFVHKHLLSFSCLSFDIIYVCLPVQRYLSFQIGSRCCKMLISGVLATNRLCRSAFKT